MLHALLAAAAKSGPSPRKRKAAMKQAFASPASSTKIPIRTNGKTQRGIRFSARTRSILFCRDISTFITAVFQRLSMICHRSRNDFSGSDQIRDRIIADRAGHTDKSNTLSYCFLVAVLQNNLNIYAEKAKPK